LFRPHGCPEGVTVVFGQNSDCGGCDPLCSLYQGRGCAPLCSQDFSEVERAHAAYLHNMMSQAFLTTPTMARTFSAVLRCEQCSAVRAVVCILPRHIMDCTHPHPPLHKWVREMRGADSLFGSHADERCEVPGLIE
jgi:hypothetical protein